jgi:hypothetical protein
MCIACELGYWAMIDALEAERAAKSEGARVSDADFVCDAPAGPQKRKPSETIVDEPGP